MPKIESQLNIKFPEQFYVFVEAIGFISVFGERFEISMFYSIDEFMISILVKINMKGLNKWLFLELIVVVRFIFNQLGKGEWAVFTIEMGGYTPVEEWCEFLLMILKVY